MIPRQITNSRGIIDARGLFVDTYGIDYRAALKV